MVGVQGAKTPLGCGAQRIDSVATVPKSPGLHAHSMRSYARFMPCPHIGSARIHTCALACAQPQPRTLEELDRVEKARMQDRGSGPEETSTPPAKPGTRGSCPLAAAGPVRLRPDSRRHHAVRRLPEQGAELSTSTLRLFRIRRLLAASVPALLRWLQNGVALKCCYVWDLP